MALNKVQLRFDNSSNNVFANTVLSSRNRNSKAGKATEPIFLSGYLLRYLASQSSIIFWHDIQQDIWNVLAMTTEEY